MIELKDTSGRLLRRFVADALDETRLEHLDLRNADFYGQFLFRAHLRGSDLRCADFRGADLIEADFREADLRGADFRLGNLGGITRMLGANLSGANLDQARLEGCEYDAHTIFPDGFDPEQHGKTRYDWPAPGDC